MASQNGPNRQGLVPEVSNRSSYPNYDQDAGEFQSKNGQRIS